jgi:deoxyribonuclease IV
MLPNGRRIGAHLPLGDGMVRAAERASSIGASALQVFSDNPAAWRRRPGLPRELPAFRERLAAHGIAPLVIHAPYLVNLAGPDGELRSRSIEVLAHELRVAQAYGARYLNVHVGSHRGAGADDGLRRFAEGVAEAMAMAGDEAPDVMLAIENGAGTGFGLGTTAEQLAAIDAALAALGVDRGRTGFCLDTAHLWAAGYRIDTAAGVDDTIATVEAGLGLARVRLVHLNDSRSEPGSHSDRHEHIGAGRIGSEGLARVLTHPGLAHVTYVLETPGMDEGYDAINLARARDLVAGRPLAELPPEAFHTRSAKGRSAPAEDGEPVAAG